MKSLLVVFSYHHKNTEKIANIIARVLDAKIKTPWQLDLEHFQEYDLIGFGAGIDSGKHYKPILDLADKLPRAENKKVFIFSTSALTGEKKAAKDHSALREKLQNKDYIILGEFQCKGFNTNSFMRFFGGMNKGRPNAQDLKNAEEFARIIRQSFNETRSNN